MIWSKEPDLPGPKKLIGGNMNAGFFGEVTTSDFITGDELARLIGLTAGTSQYSNEPWLKFAYMGNIEFIAKKPFRNSISWNNLNAANLVFGNLAINIGGHTYKIRLPKGKTEGKQDDSSVYIGTICHNSEWNNLMLPIHENAPNNWEMPQNVESPTENWGVNYSNNDLLTNSEKNRCWTWCQEFGNDKTTHLLRGGYDVSFSHSNYSYLDYDDYGWRPVLEFVK